MVRGGHQRGSGLGTVQGQRQQALPDRRRCPDRARAPVRVQVQLPEPQVPVQARAGAAAPVVGRLDARWGTASHRSGPGSGCAGRTERAEEEAAGTATARIADPAAAERRAARRAERIAAGASELEQRLTDLLCGGIARPNSAGYGAWNEAAARMVDAQAPGLAARVRELGAVASSGAGLAGRGCWRSARSCICWPRAGWTGAVVRAAARDGARAGGRDDRGGGAAAAPSPRDRWLVLAQTTPRRGS